MTNTTLLPTRTNRKTAILPAKKKCTGNCNECRTEKKAQGNTKVDATLPILVPEQTTKANEADQLTQRGVEFEAKPRKTNWRGCFVGTQDF